MISRNARYNIGQIVKHLHYDFRGVIFDVDPQFNNSQQWWESIPQAIRPAKDQPYYHLLAENEQTCYIAYVSEQNLKIDRASKPMKHPQIKHFFEAIEDGTYYLRYLMTH